MERSFPGKTGKILITIIALAVFLCAVDHALLGIGASLSAHGACQTILAGSIGLFRMTLNPLLLGILTALALASFSTKRSADTLRPAGPMLGIAGTLGRTFSHLFFDVGFRQFRQFSILSKAVVDPQR